MATLNRIKRRLAVLGVGSLLIPAMLWAQDASLRRYPMTQALVTQALKARGVNVDPSAVHLPMDLTATNPLPQLEITAAETLTEGHLRLQLRCGRRGECLPFNAMLDLRGADVLAAVAGIGNAADGADHLRSEETSSRPPSAVATALSRLRTGSQVTLVLEDDHMLIHLPAVALDSGAPGAEIRVRTSALGKMFRATVIDGTTVRGEMK
jgi:hypothetical protein